MKFMVISDENNPVFVDPWGPAGAMAAAKEINSAGGINGHPVQISNCNELANPNNASACARRAATDGVSAVVAAGIFGVLQLPILQKEGIPYLGAPISTPEASNPDMYMVENGGLDFQAMATAAAAQGAKGTAAVLTYNIPSAVALAKLAESGITPAGLKDGGLVQFAPTTADLAPVIQQLKSKNTSVVILDVAGASVPLILRAAASLGFKPTWVGVENTLDPNTLKQLGSAADGVEAASQTPPFDLTSDFPSLKQFNASMAALKGQGVAGADNPAEASVISWLSVHAAAAVAKSIQGNITAPALKAALEKAQNVNVQGIINWSPGQPGPKAYPRGPSGAMLFLKYTGGSWKIVKRVANIYPSLGVH